MYVFVCKHILKWVLIQKRRQALAKIADKVAGSLFPSWRGPCLRVIFAPGRHCTQFRADWINQAPTMAHGLNERVKSFSAQHLFATVKLTAAEILYFEKTSWESMMIKKYFSHRAPGPFYRFLSRCGVQVQVLRRPTRGTANGPITAEIFSAEPDFFAQFQHGYWFKRRITFSDSSVRLLLPRIWVSFFAASLCICTRLGSACKSTMCEKEDCVPCNAWLTAACKARASSLCQNLVMPPRIDLLQWKRCSQWCARGM